MPSIVIDTDNSVRLKDMKFLILKMKWEDLETLASDIELIRSKGIKSQCKVTGEVLYNALISKTEK